MSIKEEIQQVKEELSTEDQFFEQAVRAERFVKKYKKLLISIVVIVVGGLVFLAVTNMKEKSRIDAANKAFNLLQQDPRDQEAQTVLKAKAPKLYDAWQLSQAMAGADVEALEALKVSAVPEVADMAEYQVAVLKKDRQALDDYTYREDGIYKEMAIINDAVMLFKENKFKEAHQRLKMIEDDSPLHRLAQSLLHYGVK